MKLNRLTASIAAIGLALMRGLMWSGGDGLIALTLVGLAQA